MAHLEGDPGAWRWLRYAAGFRLPVENRQWVAHDLTDAGWRVRALLRHLVLVAPVALVFAALPAPWSLKVLVVSLVVFGAVFGALVFGDVARAQRLRQHGLPVP